MDGDAGSLGAWSVRTVDGADVRLRSGRIGLVSIDVTAPVTSGLLAVTPERVDLTLTLALDRLRTNFVMQRAARSLIARGDARVLAYDATGPRSEPPWRVAGPAIAGEIVVPMSLTVTPVGPVDSPMAEVLIVGSADLGTVSLPLPGLGTVDNFSFDVDARLTLGIESV